LGGRFLGASCDLGADPDIAAILADMHGAVHRFHGGMREERNLVRRLHLGDATGQHLGDIASVACDCAGRQRCMLEIRCDAGGRELPVPAVVPFDLERGQALLRRTHVVGNHGDAIVEQHDLAHALHHPGVAVVDTFELAAEDR